MLNKIIHGMNLQVLRGANDFYMRVSKRVLPLVREYINVTSQNIYF